MKGVIIAIAVVLLASPFAFQWVANIEADREVKAQAESLQREMAETSERTAAQERHAAYEAAMAQAAEEAAQREAAAKALGTNADCTLVMPDGRRFRGPRRADNTCFDQAK